MNELVEILKSHLKNEIKLYTVYVNFLTDLQNDVVHGDIDALDQLLHNIEFSEQDFFKLQEIRINCITSLLPHKENPTLLDLEDAISENDFEVVLDLRDELNASIDHVKHTNDVCKILLENAINYTRQRVNIFSVPLNDPYNKRGQSKHRKFKNSLDWSV